MVTLALRSEGLDVQVPPFGADRDAILEQFIQLNPDLRVEQEPDGTLTVMSPAGSESGAQNAEATWQVVNWSKQDGTGLAFDSSAGFRLPITGSMRAPDAAWISRERWRTVPLAERERFAPICPDFVLELRSLSDSLDVLLRKMVEYQQNGARLGLLLDPGTRRVWVYGPGETTPTILDDPATVSGDPVLPGFVLDVQAVWRAGE